MFHFNYNGTDNGINEKTLCLDCHYVGICTTNGRITQPISMIFFLIEKDDVLQL